MFTGLIEATGTIEAVTPAASARRMRVRSALSADLRAGDSISVNGVCLTVLGAGPNNDVVSSKLGPAPLFDVDVSPETLRVTTLGDMAPGRVVNLERPLRADARLGGHFVLGHVDGVGQIKSIDRDGDCYWLAVDAPQELGRYVISKGSIAIDGISLTVNEVDGNRFGVNIISHTQAVTSLGTAKVGQRVNLEVDMLARYVQRLLEHKT